jgi:hypothetical protein
MPLNQGQSEMIKVGGNKKTYIRYPHISRSGMVEEIIRHEG